MENIENISLVILTTIIASICTSNAIVLFLRGKNNKARRMLAYSTFLAGIFYIVRTIHFFTEPSFEGTSLFRIDGLIVGALYTTNFFLYPLEVIMPGWINKKRAIILFLPMCTICFTYFVVLSLLKQPIEKFTTINQIWNSLSHFNVWYRVVILVSSLINLAVLTKLIYQCENRYIQWQNNLYAEKETMDFSWMRQYANITILVVTTWCINIVCGNQWTLIIHYCLALCCIFFAFYKGLFHESPYPEAFFMETHDETQAAIYHEPTMIIPETKLINDQSFDSKIPEYLETFKTWMENEKPFLYCDFKLTDVSRVLPLNRTYLSRIFNEGLGMNFSEVVRNYRIEYAKKVIKTHPDFPLYKVAELCGFTSDSTFNKAFNKVTGTTPKLYKKNT